MGGQLLPLEEPEGQGLDPNQEESGNRAILALLTDPEVRDQTDLVITFRDGAYEVWALRGMVRFSRVIEPGGSIGYEVVEQIGENPIANQNAAAVATIGEELRASSSCGNATTDPDRAFLEPAVLSYPFACERIAQLFDCPDAPDLIVNPKCYAFGLQPGAHGALDVVQSRTLLAFSGPGVSPGAYAIPARQIDIAPTVCRLMRFPLIHGADASGRTASERGRDPDVYLRRQDGSVLEAIVDPQAPAPARVYMIVLDGLSFSELGYNLDRNAAAVANLRRIIDRSAFFTAGAVGNFPSITWPAQASIVTGTWCGHHGIVNASYYIRREGKEVWPQWQGTETERFLSPRVETLYEVFHRVLGHWRRPDGSFAAGGAFTASIYEPQGRGADHAALERRLVGDRARLKALTVDHVADINPRWQRDGKTSVHQEAIIDSRGLAQVEVLLDAVENPIPTLIIHEFTMTDASGHDYGPHHEGLRAALEETDRRVGRVLDLLEEKDLLDSTMFVVTSDHGMAAQRVELDAHPARYLERVGLKALMAESMIWLRDMDVRVQQVAHGGAVRVSVCNNDTDGSGEKPPVENAEVTAYGSKGLVVAQVRTDDAGVAAFDTPADITSADMVLSVRHPDFNPRHLRLDGTNLAADLRRLLYGDLLKKD
jgi:hypothetical protein